MPTQLKVIQGDQRKASLPVNVRHPQMNELQYIMDFNQSISLAMAKTMQHLSNFVFFSMEDGKMHSYLISYHSYNPEFSKMQ